MSLSWPGKFIVALFPATIAGCAADSPIIDNVLLAPGYFETLDCPEIVARFYSASEQVTKLTALMERAAADPVGPLVNAIAYNTDYAKARVAQKHAQQAAQLKGCDLSKKPEPAVPKPGSGNADLLGHM